MIDRGSERPLRVMSQEPRLGPPNRLIKGFAFMASAWAHHGHAGAAPAGHVQGWSHQLGGHRLADGSARHGSAQAVSRLRDPSQTAATTRSYRPSDHRLRRALQGRWSCARRWEAPTMRIVAATTRWPKSFFASSKPRQRADRPQELADRPTGSQLRSSVMHLCRR